MGTEILKKEEKGNNPVLTLILNYYHKFLDIFNKCITDKLPPYRPGVNYIIKLRNKNRLPVSLFVRCVTSDKGPSTTWLSMWLSTCRDSNPDLWKRGKWVVIKSRALELRGYEESRIAALTYTHT